jgi:uncharacterized membrane protein YqaE (UPF0057 family)
MIVPLSDGAVRTPGSLGRARGPASLLCRVRNAPAVETFDVQRNREQDGYLVDIIRIIIAIFIPPLAVFTQVGLGKHFWINLLLTLCGWLPGVIHAFWVIGKY